MSCEYCKKIWKDRKEIFDSGIEFDGETVIIMGIDRLYIYSTDEDYLVVEADYCPKCGRKLIVEEKEFTGFMFTPKSNDIIKVVGNDGRIDVGL